MAIKWGRAIQVPPGMWGKAGIDDQGNWHILYSEKPENIAKPGSIGHDHYFKRGGKWHVQIRTSRHALLADEKGHTYEPNTPFDSIPPEILDNLFRQLAVGLD